MKTLNRMDYFKNTMLLALAWILGLVVAVLLPPTMSSLVAVMALVGFFVTMYFSVVWMVRRARHINPDNVTVWVIMIFMLNLITGIGGTLLLLFVPGSDRPSITSEMLTIEQEKHEMEKERHQAWKDNQ